MHADFRTMLIRGRIFHYGWLRFRLARFDGGELFFASQFNDNYYSDNLND